MKKLIAILVLAVMAIALVACSGNTGAPSTEKPADQTDAATAAESTVDTDAATDAATDADTALETGNTQIANPIKEAESADAFEELGITLTTPLNAENMEYSIISDKIAQINFKYEEHEYCLRASKEEEDIAGLYGDKISEKKLPGGAVLTALADGEKTLYKVEWDRNGVFYSLTNTDGASDAQVSGTYEDVR